MTFRDILESKQIGTLYHFTRGRNLIKILNGSEKLNPFDLISWNNVISCTRNACMSSEIFQNDFSIKDGYIVRISLDGTKMSNKFKILPIAGYSNNDTDIFNHKKNDKRIHRSTGEFEEVILKSKINIKEYIKQIDIYNYDSKSQELYETVKEICEKNNITLNLVRKFNIVENVDSEEFFGIL